MVVTLADQLTALLRDNISRQEKAVRIADTIRAAGPYRWVGVYEVDRKAEVVRNIAWSGPSPPAFPTFRIYEGLTARAIRSGRVVNVSNVNADPQYLTALGSTESELIIPVADESGTVVGTIDVESERLDAFSIEAENQLKGCAAIIRELWLS